MRRAFPLFILALVAAAVVWATSFATIEKAEFTFCNGTEIKSVDPAIVVGVPESRVVYGIFEGLVNFHPRTLEPTPGVAERWDVSEDGLTYTFHLNPEARWSDGTNVTAEDFRWSWRRMLHPQIAAQYSYQAYYIRGAERFNTLQFEPGDRVEVELDDRPVEDQMYPTGTLLTGELVEVEKYNAQFERLMGDDAEGDAVEHRVFVVNMDKGGQKRWNNSGADAAQKLNAQYCNWVVLDFDTMVGVKAVDDSTLEVTLANSTPFFLKLVAFYTLFPVHRPSIEKYGEPDWTRPEALVCNGAFVISERRIRDRIRLTKNPHYWNRDAVALNTIDALAVQSSFTMLNLFEKGEVDWITDRPAVVVPQLMQRENYLDEPQLSTYFYRLNTTVKPLDDVRVRRALFLAIDRQAMVDRVTRGGERPTDRIVPPGMEGYETELNPEFNPEEARRLLADAGFPNGKGFPRLEILYNTNEAHKEIAEVVQAMWSKNLGIRVGLVNMEWQSYLERTHQMQYSVARAGWNGDYVDPNTFLDMWVTGGGNNETGWSNAEYDRLIAAAAKESDSAKRMELFKQAEDILVSEKPIIPVYHYVSKNLIGKNVRGFYANPLDLHPLWAISIEKPEGEAEAQAGE
jgi:oligopeptide transport system substrate-binding protein